MSRFEPVDAGKLTDNCSVNVCYIGDKLYALTETTLMRQVDPASLETIGEHVRINNKHFKMSFSLICLFR